MNLKSIHGTLALLVIAGLGCDIARAQEDEFIKHAAEIVGGGISFDSGFATLDRVEVHFKALLDLPPVVWYSVRSSGGGAGGAGAGANPSDANNTKPPATSNTSPDCTNPTTKQPVIIATGEKIKPEPDFEAASDYGLSHSRTYRSFGTSGSMFGAKWSSAYDYPSLKR